MTKTYALLAFLLFSTSCLHAQFFKNGYFGSFQQQPCPFNPAATVNWPENWQLYQTTDGHWDGPIDSTRCITGTPYNGNYALRIDLKQVDPTRPLFIRAEMDTLPQAYELSPNDVYNLYINAFTTPSAVPLVGGEACPDQLCTGALIGISIPDEQGNPGAALRFQTGLLTFYAPNPTICYITGESCFPTERFDDQFVREFILKFTLDSTANLANTALVVSSVDIVPVSDPFLGVRYLTEIPAFINPINVGDVATPGFIDNYLGLYTAPTYPGPQNLSYIEARPVPNTTTPQDVTLTVAQYQVLEMQPFAQFRGGLVVGSDTLRHHFTLVNDGGELCFNFIDLIFDGGDAYRHSGGQIDVNNPYSCMQFKNGGKLQVSEGATLHYGRQGMGMLVVCANSTIELERNATLIVDAILQISECNDALPPSQIYIDLPPGAKLAFTQDAWITNRFSKNQQMRLNVRMLGGTLDDSALDPGSRALIRRIDPEPAPRLADNLQLFPNPSTGPLQLRYLAGAAETLRLRWLDAQGRLVQEEQFAAGKGWNEWAPAGPEAPGLYFAEIRAAGDKHVQRIVRLKN